MKRSGKGRYKVYRSNNQKQQRSTALHTPHPYGDEWEAISAYVRRRDGYRCQIHRLNSNRRCHNYFPPPFQHLLHAHHIVRREASGSDHPRNLLCICTDCHSYLHGRRIGRAITQKQKRAARRTSS